MAAKKVTKKTVYTAGIKLVLEVGIEIEANSLVEAVTKAEALKVHDIIDFGALGLDYNDSQAPEVRTVWING